MDPKNLVYAAVGAPIAAAKTLNARMETIRGQVGARSESLAEMAQKQLDDWAVEGRKVIDDMTDGKVVDELASKVDFDQAREQVSKLRDQLEDMLATWRTSFRPVEEGAKRAANNAADAVEKAGDEIEKATDKAAKTVKSKTTTRATSKKPAAKKAPAKKAPTKKPAAKNTTTKKTASSKA